MTPLRQTHDTLAKTNKTTYLLGLSTRFEKMFN